MPDTLPIEETDRLIASDKVEGSRVYDRQGNKLGSVLNFMVDKRTGKAEYVVMEFGGLFGFDREYYPVPWDALSYYEQQGGYVIALDKDQLAAAPHYREMPQVFDSVFGRQIYGYYGLTYPF